MGASHRQAASSRPAAPDEGGDLHAHLFETMRALRRPGNRRRHEAPDERSSARYVPPSSVTVECIFDIAAARRCSALTAPLRLTLVYAVARYG